ncbi:MAG: transposase [Candidatus Competibacteraceae bacterium]|nr:transposase [Candidatus Competibacteraceae bacterium]MCB1804173.1 transposase [Candidatus Competibacteraceae bacterium]MCB1810292.1 transposase [Candidatus Competibacteraceae bacterium]
MNRKRFSNEFKSKVALEAIRGHKTTAELASEYSVHPTQIGSWKKHALEALPGLFSGKAERQVVDHEAEKSRLYEQIGKLQIELEWIKKSRLIGAERRCQAGADRPASSGSEPASPM